MFSGCPSTRPSVRARQNDHYSDDRPTHWLFVRPSVRPESFPDIILRTQKRNGLKCCMLMYPGHLQNLLDFGHGLLIFILSVPLWLSETGQIWCYQAFYWECMGGGMVWILACWCILTTFRTDKILVVLCWLSSFWCHFGWLKIVTFEVSGHFLENTC